MFLEGGKCLPKQCPAKTLASPESNACFGGANGQFCRAFPDNKCGAKGGSPLGGAAMVLQTADTSAPACKAGAWQPTDALPLLSALLRQHPAPAPPWCCPRCSDSTLPQPLRPPGLC